MSSPYLSILCLFLLAAPPFNNARRPIKMKLIHIDSPESPYRMNYDSPDHEDKIWEEISKRRVHRLFHGKLPSEYDGEGGYHPYLTRDPSGVFLASLGVGTPPKQQFLAVDTGSTITWITCVYSRFKPGNYDYVTSNTSTRLLCSDDECRLIPFNTCPLDPEFFEPCDYSVRYASSQTRITGPLVTDDFTFFEEPPVGENITEPLIIFGCGYLEGPIGEEFNGTGVMGLSNGMVSLATQLGPSFSYCVGNIYKKMGQYSTLTLGEGELMGKWTNILYNDNKVYVSLRSITVGGEALEIDPKVFQRDNKTFAGGTIIDSGSTVTYLADEAYKVFRKRMVEKMTPEVNSKNSFCIEGLKPYQVPQVQLIFEQGAALTLGMEALFRPLTTFQCLNGIKPTSSTPLADITLSLIGINAQQFHNMGYDYENRKLYIEQISCNDA